MGEQVADLFISLSLITAPFAGALKGALIEGESFSKAVGGWSGAMTKLGFATYAAAGVVAVASIKMAADFQTSMVKLTTSAGETQSNLAMVSNGVLNVAVATGTSTSQLASGMYQIESAGFHGAAGLQVLKAAAEGARAEGADLSEVSNALTTALTDYHLPASQAVAVTNQLITAVGQGKMTMQDLAGSLHSVLPIAASAGLSLAQVTGAVATMTAQGMSADQATVDLANTISSLQNPSLVAQKAMAGIGLSSTEVSKDLGSKGLTGTMNELYVAIMQHMGPSGLVLMNTFNRSQQAASSLKAMLAAMPADVRRLASSLQDGSLTAGEYSKAIKKLPVDQQVLGQQFATLLKQSDGFSQTLKSGSGDALTFNAVLAKVTGGSTGLNTALMLTGKNATTLNANVEAVAKASQHAGSNINGWSQITSTFNFTMSQLKELVETLAIRIGEKLIPVVQAVITFFMRHKSAAIALAAVIGTALVVALGYATIAVWTFTAALLANPVTWIIIGIAAVIVAIVMLVTHWRQVWGFIKRIAEDVGHFLVGIWHWVASEASRIWNDDIVGPVVDAWNTIAGFFDTGYHIVVDPILEGWHTLERVTSEVFGRIASFFRKWWPLLLAIFLPPVVLIWGLWHRYHALIEGVAKEVWSRISGFFLSIWGVIRSTAVNAWHAFYDAVITPVEDAAKFIYRIWLDVASWLRQWYGMQLHAVEAAWHAIYNAVIKPVMQIYSDVASWFAKVGTTITTKLGDAWHSLVNIGDKWLTIGENIVLGIVHGVEHQAGHLYDSVKNMANTALHDVTSFLGISSPSKKFIEVGMWSGEGAAVGVESKIARVAASARNLAKAALSGFGSPQLAVNAVLARGGSSSPSAGSYSAPPGVLAAGSSPGASQASAGGTTVVNEITVQGLIAATDLARIVQTATLRAGARNSHTYLSYQQARGRAA